MPFWLFPSRSRLLQEASRIAKDAKHALWKKNSRAKYIQNVSPNVWALWKALKEIHFAPGRKPIADWKIESAQNFLYDDLMLRGHKTATENFSKIRP